MDDGQFALYWLAYAILVFSLCHLLCSSAICITYIPLLVIAIGLLNPNYTHPNQSSAHFTHIWGRYNGFFLSFYSDRV
jgi:hypothetical protein